MKSVRFPRRGSKTTWIHMTVGKNGAKSCPARAKLTNACDDGQADPENE